MSRKIRMTLDPQSISRAIREVELYEKDLKRKIGLLVERLVNDGVEIAKMHVSSLDAVYTGELLNSIDGYFDASKGIGYVRAGSPYAIFVEFGTGVVGEGTSGEAGAIDAHGAMYWEYDINGHGLDGWTYFNEKDGQFYHTLGQPARPFMSMTTRLLDSEVERVVTEVFGR